MKKLLRKLFSENINVQNNYKKSYSQDGEDMILSSMFDDLGGRDRGFYIDVGALHPFRFSNTAYFYEKGWSGINIEPTPTAIEAFNKYRVRDVNLNIGIGENETELTFYCFDEPALNSFSKELSKERNDNTIYNITDEIKIKIYPLHQILKKYVPDGKKIDFLSIDVEGLDMSVLKSNDWQVYSPEFMLVEDIIDIENLAASEVYSYLSALGYVLKAKTERTLIFKQSGLAC